MTLKKKYLSNHNQACDPLHKICYYCMYHYYYIEFILLLLSNMSQRLVIQGRWSNTFTTNLLMLMNQVLRVFGHNFQLQMTK